MNTPIAVRIECAKGEILNAMETELINSTNTMMAEKNEELEKAKKAAKRVLKTEPDEEHPEQDEPENPEE